MQVWGNIRIHTVSSSQRLCACLKRDTYVRYPAILVCMIIKLSFALVAEAAFFDQSILELLYFPDDQK